MMAVSAVMLVACDGLSGFVKERWLGSGARVSIDGWVVNFRHNIKVRRVLERAGE